METSVLINALNAAAEHEENIALKMLLTHSSERLNEMKVSMLETADVISAHSNLHTLSEILKLEAEGK